MPIIKPISDLRNNFNEVSDICHRENEPVFITKNGKGDLVVMSVALYEQQRALLDLYRMLGAAEDEGRSDAERTRHRALMDQLRGKLDEKKR
jgi:prevent-host-death family protein